jgi:tyrosine-protein kinase Etk/Wzc
VNHDDLQNDLDHDNIDIMDHDEQQEEKTPLEMLLFVWNIIWNYRILIILLTFLGAVSTVIFAVMSLKLPVEQSPLPNVYRSYTRVIIQENSANGGDNVAAMMDMMGFSSSGSQGMTNGNLAQMVYNSFPYADVISERMNFEKKYSIFSDYKTRSRAIFYGSSSFSFDNRTRIMRLSYSSTDKYFATEVVEVMLEELQNWFMEQGGVNSQSQLSNIESKIFDVSKEIKRLEDQIKSIQSEYGVLSIDDLADSQQTLMSSLNEQLMTLDLQISQQTNTQSSYSPIETSAVKSLKAQREDVASTLYRLQNGYPVGGRTYPPIEEMPNISLDFNRLTLLLHIQEGIYQSLTEQYEVLRLSGGGSLALTVLEPAEIPEEKYGPKRSMICVQGTLGMFFFGVALAFLLTFLKIMKARREERFIPLDDE